MTYAVQGIVGAQPIANTETTATHILGTIVQGVDPTYGQGEFIYLLGVANTVTGMVVRYDRTSYLTSLLTVADKNTGVPLAVAMSANVASQYGWYQITGNAVIKKTSVSVNPMVPIYISATDGRIKVLTSAGQQIVGARTANLSTIVTTTSTVVVTISRPHCQSQIT